MLSLVLASFVIGADAIPSGWVADRETISKGSNIKSFDCSCGGTCCEDQLAHECDITAGCFQFSIYHGSDSAWINRGQLYEYNGNQVQGNSGWDTFWREQVEVPYQVQVGLKGRDSLQLEHVGDCDEQCAKRVCSGMAGCESFAMCTGGGGDSCKGWVNTPQFYSHSTGQPEENHGWTLWSKEFDSCFADASQCDSHSLATAVDTLCPPDSSLLVEVHDDHCNDAFGRVNSQSDWLNLSEDQEYWLEDLAVCLVGLGNCLACAIPDSTTTVSKIRKAGGCIACTLGYDIGVCTPTYMSIKQFTDRRTKRYQKANLRGKEPELPPQSYLNRTFVSDQSRVIMIATDSSIAPVV